MIRDREEAGRLLAQRLGAYCDDPDALILALPRGGVAVGYTLSLALHLPLDVLITRKLGAPGNPEYAMGALSETGAIFLNPDAERIINAGIWSRVHLADTIQAQRGEITRRQTLYRSGRPLPSLSDRSVLLVDDGVATGSTFLASIKALRGLNVQRLIAALPVGPVDTLSEISRTVDELVVLLAPEPFFAVGNHYEDFKQVEDEEVIRYLASAADGLRDRNHAAHA
ncbi:MAG: phosphoribosyltransferase family protein [Nitrospirales bacterium]